MADAKPTSAATRPSRRPLVLMAVIAVAPVLLSTMVYFFFPRSAATNYGRLLDVGPAPDIVGTHGDGTPFRLAGLQGKWVLMVAAGGGCDTSCRRELYATRQARTIQGAEQERIVRVWLIADAETPAPDVLREHPGITTVHVDRAALGRLPRGGAAIYLIDPRGNLVLEYPEDPDIKALANDLKRLLRASSIG